MSFIMDGFMAAFRQLQSLRNSEAREPGRHASAASVGIIALTVMGLMGGRVEAATSDGTLITNVACATYGTLVPSCNLQVSYCVTQVVLVVNPNIQIMKTATPSIECAGSTVTFCIWVANTSAYTSAFNVHIEDIIPGSSGVMSYQQGQTTWVAGTTGATLSLSYGAGRAPWGAFYTNYPGECPNGQTGPYAIRWVVSLVGPRKSAMLCWKASIL